MDSLDSYIDAVEHLPTPPVVMVQLIALFRQPEADVDGVVDLLRRDPSLTAEVLRRCNTAAFGGDEPVVDVFDAIMRMGFYEVYQTAVAIFSRKMMSIEVPVGNIAADDFWRHSAATAVLSGLVAKDLGETEGVAYTAGLLHDTGKLVLALAEGTKYGDLMRQVGMSGGRALQNAERDTFGFGHAAIGARLLERWNVPPDIAVPVFHHHRFDCPAPFSRLALIIKLADMLAHYLEEGTYKDFADFPDAEDTVKALRMDSVHAAELAQKAREEIESMQGVLGA